jgi:hypothetical protein|tara:strand:- start:450 stop:1004 length:555 start_codon:yes stop_codon:yes gene_type:complete
MAFQIHMSHSRKELLDVIRIFKLPVPNRNDKNKSQLQDAIVECVDYLPQVKAENEYFFVQSKEDLIDYLKLQNPAKNLTIAEKDDVMIIAKKLIAYCKMGYMLGPSDYFDTSEIYRDARYIAKFAEIPSVRKAIDSVNQDPKLREKIDMKIPRRTANQLKKKKAVKKNAIPLFIKRGEFVLDFS